MWNIFSYPILVLCTRLLHWPGYDLFARDWPSQYLALYVECALWGRDRCTGRAFSGGTNKALVTWELEVSVGHLTTHTLRGRYHCAESHGRLYRDCFAARWLIWKFLLKNRNHHSFS